MGYWPDGYPFDERARCLVESKPIRRLLRREVHTVKDHRTVLWGAYQALRLATAKSGCGFDSESSMYRAVQISILRKRRLDRSRQNEHLRTTAVQTEQNSEFLSRMTPESLLLKLPEPARDVFRLRVMEGLSYPEIALRTNLALPAVASLVFHARDVLARLFGVPLLP